VSCSACPSLYVEDSIICLHNCYQLSVNVSFLFPNIFCIQQLDDATRCVVVLFLPFFYKFSKFSNYSEKFQCLSSTKPFIINLDMPLLSSFGNCVITLPIPALSQHYFKLTQSSHSTHTTPAGKLHSNPWKNLRKTPHPHTTIKCTHSPQLLPKHSFRIAIWWEMKLLRTRSPKQSCSCWTPFQINFHKIPTLLCAIAVLIYKQSVIAFPIQLTPHRN
jgi:hypothetical protein